MDLSVRPLHVALYVGIMLLWGLNFPVAKMGLAQLPPIFMIALRFMLVAAVLVPFVKWPRGQWKPILAVSVTLGLIHFSLMFTGLRDLDASTAAISIQLQVPISSALAAIFLGDQLGWRRALGMVIAFAGVALIAGEPRLQGQYLAFALVLAATSMWAIANLQIKMMKQIDGLVLNAWVAGFGAPQLLAASLLLEDGQMAALAAADWRAAFSIFYQALFVVVIGYGAWYWLLQRYDVNQSMPFTLLVPVFGVSSAIVFLGEQLTAALAAGGFLTILGVGIITLRRPRTTAPEMERL